MKHLWLMLGSLLAAALAGNAIAASSSDWPDRPVRIIVPAPPGGPYDRIIRPLAQNMGKTLGQPVIVENRPGAANIIGAQAGARAQPDGYTLTMTGMVNTIAHSLYPDIAFDIANDFEHIGSIGDAAQWLAVRSDAGISSFGDLVRQAQIQPGKIDYASSGSGSTGHLIMEMMQRDLGISLTHIPYKGGAPALQDMLGGIVTTAILPLNVLIPHVQSGALRILAVSSPKRHAVIPDAPTMRELGYPQLEVSSWVGLSAPKGTPRSIVDTISAALRVNLNDSAFLAQMETDGMAPLFMTPEAYNDLVRADTQRWGELVQSLGLKAN